MSFNKYNWSVINSGKINYFEITLGATQTRTR